MKRAKVVRNLDTRLLLVSVDEARGVSLVEDAKAKGEHHDE
jgi:hypothetical protein